MFVRSKNFMCISFLFFSNLKNNAVHKGYNVPSRYVVCLMFTDRLEICVRTKHYDLVTKITYKSSRYNRQPYRRV